MIDLNDAEYSYSHELNKPVTISFLHLHWIHPVGFIFVSWINLIIGWIVDSYKLQSQSYVVVVFNFHSFNLIPNLELGLYFFKL